MNGNFPNCKAVEEKSLVPQSTHFPAIPASLFHRLERLTLSLLWMVRWQQGQIWCHVLVLLGSEPIEIPYFGPYKNNHRNSHNLLCCQPKGIFTGYISSLYFLYLSQISLLRPKLSSKTWLPELFLEWKKSFFHILRVFWNGSACFTFSLFHIPSLAPCPVIVGLSYSSPTVP